MEPAYFPGERVLTFNWKKPKTSDVVVLRKNSKFFLKRVDSVDKGRISIFGDNKKMSSKFEPISISQIVGVVILKY